MIADIMPLPLPLPSQHSEVKGPSIPFSSSLKEKFPTSQVPALPWASIPIHEITFGAAVQLQLRRHPLVMHSVNPIRIPAIKHCLARRTKISYWIHFWNIIVSSQRALFAQLLVEQPWSRKWLGTYALIYCYHSRNCPDRLKRKQYPKFRGSKLFATSGSPWHFRIWSLPALQ